MLAHAGAIGFYVPQAHHEAALRFNQVLAELIARGAPYGFMALPGLGSALPLDEIQWLAIHAVNQGADGLQAVIEAVAAGLKALNKSLLKDGQPLGQGAEMHAELKTRLEPFMQDSLPRLRALGGVR